MLSSLEAKEGKEEEGDSEEKKERRAILAQYKEKVHKEIEVVCKEVEVGMKLIRSVYMCACVCVCACMRACVRVHVLCVQSTCTWIHVVCVYVFATNVFVVHIVHRSC